MRHLLVIMIALLGLLVSNGASAQSMRPPAHVEVVLDTSGSMKENDQQRLSVLAAMIFTDLAEPGDALGVLGMSSFRGSYALRSLSAVGEETRGIKRSFRNARFNGATDCAGPLETAAEELKARRKNEPGAEQFVVFLSDGLCPNDEDGGDRLGDTARMLANRGVRIFTIGLFPDGGEFEKDPLVDLTRMARMTRGDFFRARSAGDVPARFADILGRILGSQAQVVSIQEGTATLDVDDYLVDASLVVTSDGGPALVSRLSAPNDRVFDLPTRKPPFDHRDTGLAASADTNGRSQFYEVVRLESPTAGQWTMNVNAQGGVRAILIQNYALDPVLELPEKRDKYKIEEELEPVVYLRGPDGKRITDAKFLDKVDFTLEYQEPDGKKGELELKRGEDGACRGRLPLDAEGRYQLNARAAMKSGGLDKATDAIVVESMALDLIVAPSQGPIDFGTVKAGERSEPNAVDLSASKIGSAYDLTLELSVEGDGDIENVPGEAPISPASQVIEVAFDVDTDHPGGTANGTLEIRYGKQVVKIPVMGEVIPLTFWERYGKLIMALGSGLLGLALLLFIIMGFVRPFNFAPTARVKYAETMKKLNRQKGTPIRQIKGTRSGFYKNALLHIGGDERPYLFPVGSEPLATLEAVGPGRIEIAAGKGVELRKINEFRPDRENDQVVEGGKCSFRSGEIYRLGKFIIECC